MPNIHDAEIEMIAPVDLKLSTLGLRDPAAG